MVRSGKCPLVQIVKRLEEMEKSKFFREHTQADACEILKIKMKKTNIKQYLYTVLCVLEKTFL